MTRKDTEQLPTEDQPQPEIGAKRSKDPVAGEPLSPQDAEPAASASAPSGVEKCDPEAAPETEAETVPEDPSTPVPGGSREATPEQPGHEDQRPSDHKAATLDAEKGPDGQTPAASDFTPVPQTKTPEQREADLAKSSSRFGIKITNKALEGGASPDADLSADVTPDTEPVATPQATADAPTEPDQQQAEPPVEPESAGPKEVNERALKNLTIEPSAAQVKPSESVTFALKATTEDGALAKVANPTWASQGGEIDENGVYVAGTAAGTHRITAKTGSLSATAEITIVVPKPVWKVLEPEDQTDRVEHEDCDSWDRDTKWRIIAASVRGKLHAHKALWRDDSYDVDWVHDWTIVAVGDGAGSAKLSRIGSRIACNAAVASLKGLLEDFDITPRGKDQPKDTDLQKLKSFLVLAASEARNELVREAHDRECNLKDLSTTLLVAVHSPWKKKHLVASVQVGDGAIGVFEKGGECTVLGVADHGEFSSETVFLTSGSELVKKPLDQRVLFTLKPNVQCIAVMCDGVADDFFPEEKRLVQLFNGDPIQDMQTADGNPVQGVMQSVIPNPRDGKTLQEWLTYEKKGSSDDRTLVLMYRR